MHSAIAEILKHPGIWRGDGFSQAHPDTLSSGHLQLDAVLPGGGWPQAAVSEIIARQAGCGELKLLLPALANLTQARKQVLLIAPPHIPYAPAWQAAGIDLRYLTWVDPESENDALWTMEQALREPDCGAVVAWFEHAVADRNCRRLQVAAETGGGCGFVLRQGRADNVVSPFGLRLAVEPAAGGVGVQVIKRRGSPLARPIFLPHRQLSAPNPSGIRHVVAGTAFPLAPARRAADPVNACVA
ncbi:MAG: translesion DNA synthesis-associated protein ImuA [Burkholderiales bacterium]|nr:translesion DNA synthesis-associated protein ImuA [Burkholderiales bacterium]